MMRSAALLLVPALVLTAGGTTHKKQARRGGPVNSAKEAKDIAEREVGGIAVSAHRIHLNGATSGWEVDVHMPREDKGWRCTIDSDTHMVHTKDRIPNPKTGKNHR
ncbi:MAG: PepSY domain-containing protein [Holophaga sp.]|nr:PepSY domain-containing protein [Holophaga sp.]